MTLDPDALEAALAESTDCRGNVEAAVDAYLSKLAEKGRDPHRPGYRCWRERRNR